MSLQGFYTNKGSALAAKIAAGTAALTVTRVVAGSGHTADIPSATSLPDIEQTLTVGTAVVEGTTATLPVTLAEAQAESSYSLTELGVYAADPQEGEVLMQVYQLSSAAAITAHGEDVLRFFLRQTIGAQGVSVVCSPAGIVLDGEFAPLQEKIMATEIEDKEVTCAANALQAYLDTLPRLLNENLSIRITGAATEAISLNGFYGNGSIRLEPASSGAGTSLCGVYIVNCHIKIALYELTITPGANPQSSWPSCVYASEAVYVIIAGCNLPGDFDAASRGVEASLNSAIYMNNCTLQNHGGAILVARGTNITIENGIYSNNAVGITTWHGGTAILTGTAPNTLGAPSNSKTGGLIVSANGSII